MDVYDEERDGAIPERLSFTNALFINPQRYKSYYQKLVRERLKETKLTETSLYALITLDDEIGVSLKELSALVGVDKALITRMIRHLDDLGYVNIGKGPGKEYSVTLTEEGVKTRKKAKAIIEEVNKILTEDLTDEEKDALQIIAAKMIKKMESYSDNK